jgi:putative spermidine/putrescine transport system permease protein
MRSLRRPRHLVLRDQIDPTIAAISTMMIGVTTVLFLLSQLLGKSREH